MSTAQGAHILPSGTFWTLFHKCKGAAPLASLRSQPWVWSVCDIIFLCLGKQGWVINNHSSPSLPDLSTDSACLVYSSKPSWYEGSKNLEENCVSWDLNSYLNVTHTYTPTRTHTVTSTPNFAITVILFLYTNSRSSTFGKEQQRAKKSDLTTSWPFIVHLSVRHYVLAMIRKTKLLKTTRWQHKY